MAALVPRARDVLLADLEQLRRPFGWHELMNVVVVTRDPLAAVAQYAAPVMPLSQAVGDDDLVPEGPFGSDGCDVANAKIELGRSAAI